MNKYENLTAFLRNVTDSVTLSFREIAEIIHDELPQSAVTHRAWWSNSTQNSYSKNWLSAGCLVDSWDVQAGTVTFFRNEEVAQNIMADMGSGTRTGRRTTHAFSLITEQEIIEQADAVAADSTYGAESQLIHEALTRFPRNDDLVVIAMKIGLIDITNSTHISQYKSQISVHTLASFILNCDFDRRVAEGDPTLVEDIARNTGAINLFSFASKYCTYHNVDVYGRDDYSILDGRVKEGLPKFKADLTQTQIETWRKTFNYRAFNDCVGEILDANNIHIPFRRRKFDYYIWNTNKGVDD